MNQPYQNLDKSKSYQKLKILAKNQINLKQVLSQDRIKKYIVSNPPLSMAYATTLINDEILQELQNLADEQKVIEKYNKILNAQIMNVGEKRKVLHHLARSHKDSLYNQQRKKIADFVKKIHNGTIKSYNGKKFDTVVQIGIGGSDLGPRALYIALKRYVKELKHQLPLEAKFIANVDPDDANEILDSINFETTLFVVVSKSGTTQETLTNLAFVQQKALNYGITQENLKKHFVAVTGQKSPMDDPENYIASFYIDDYIGGRFSSTSAVGGTVLALAFGMDIFEEFLKGAFTIDNASQNENIFKNAPLLSALIGIWERNFLNLPAKAIIPYSEALSRFPAHLQQLDCESNGKSVNIFFEPINYDTSPMIFGEPGTNGQHSFFQKLHQGTDVIPIQFIGFKKPQIEKDLVIFGSTSQEKLNANLVAQITALALGKDHKNANKKFPGNRPSSLIFADQLTPFTLGALLSFYENSVMFQGFVWNINSFDQEGVQLGKLLTKNILDTDKTPDSILNSIYSLLKKS